MGSASDSRNELMLGAWQAMMAHTQDFMFVKDLSLVYVAASQPFARLVGRGSADEVVGRTDQELFTDQELAKRYVEDDRQMLREGKSLGAYVEPIPSEGGRQRYSETRKSVIRDGSGRAIGVFGMGRDVTREYIAKLNYERERRYLLELPADAYHAMLVDVNDWRVLEKREGERADGGACCDDLDRYAAELLQTVVEGEAARRFFMDFTKEHLRRVFGDGIRNLMFPFKRGGEDQGARWVREDIHMMTNPESMHLEALVVLRDIDMKTIEKDLLVRAAEQDSMTGLLNHEATFDHIRRYMTGEGAGKMHALFMIDIDNFKDVNDRYGHQCGDSVIVDTAAVVRGAFRESDIVGRVGGDEFLALMKKVERLSDVERKAAYLVEKLHGICFDKEGGERLSGSVGLAVCAADGRDLEALYAEADAALYDAKHNGKSCYTIVGAERMTEQ